MANEIKITDLPVMNLSSFTGNDHFLVVDDQKARLLTLSDFRSWMLSNVQGEKGDQGVAGKNGINGTSGTNGTNGKSAYEIAVDEGFSGTQSDWIKSVQGVKGDKGETGVQGNNGYSPVYRLVSNSNGVFVQITDWTGGSGNKPNTGYLSSSGIVSNINNATSIQGTKGDAGLQGIKGDQGATGSEGIQGANGFSAYDVAVQDGFTGTDTEWLASLVGKPVKSVVFNDDRSITITDSSGSSVSSSPIPNQKIDVGFQILKDSAYTQTSPLNLIASTEVRFNNDAVSGYKSYDGVLYSPPNTLKVKTGSWYKIKISFASVSATNFTISIKDGSETLFESIFTGKIGKNKTEIEYFSKDGKDLTVFISSDADNSIYNLEETVVKLI